MARPFAWEKSYPAGMRWDAPITRSTVPALLTSAVARFSDKPALDFRGAKISYGELAREAERVGAAFVANGMKPGDPLALYLPNTPYHPYCFFGGAKAGLRLVHLSPLDAPAELAHKLHDSGARTIVTTNVAGMMEKAIGLLDAGHADLVIVADDAAFGPSPAPAGAIPERKGVVSLAAFTQAATPPPIWPDVTPDDVILLQYTGGTTGLPKGAILTHGNLTAAISMYEAWSKGIGQHAQSRRIICVLPLFHIYALTTILLRGLDHGAELLLRMRFDVESILRDIEVGRATHFPGVPTMWIALNAAPGIEKRDFSSLLNVSSGGAPLPVEVGERFERLTGHKLIGGWGMTETSPAGTNRLPDGKAKPGTIGLPLPGIELEICALDDPSRPLGPNETGELRIRGHNVTRGYWNRPEETAAAFAGDWFLTGDIGHMDEDGYFFITDRKKDMIISGGFNVYPQMIEQAVYQHPDVEECLVVGVPDGYRGEAAKAFVKLRAGSAPLTLEALLAFLKDKLGRHEMPAALEIRPALPRTAVGKLSKVELRREERDKAASRDDERGAA